MHLWEERKVIDYLIASVASHIPLEPDEEQLVANSFRIMTDNLELKRDALERLLDLFYLKMAFKPIDFQRDKKRGFIWGDYYRIPKDRAEATKKLQQRFKKRREVIETAWFREFRESFGWDKLRTDSKKTSFMDSIGETRMADMVDSRDPSDAVILPFKR